MAVQYADKLTISYRSTMAAYKHACMLEATPLFLATIKGLVIVIDSREGSELVHIADWNSGSEFMKGLGEPTMQLCGYGT